eukprot:513155_1
MNESTLTTNNPNQLPLYFDLDNDLIDNETGDLIRPYQYHNPLQFINRKESNSLSRHINSHSLHDNNPRNDAPISHKTRKSPPPAPIIFDEFCVQSSKRITFSHNNTCIASSTTSVLKSICLGHFAIDSNSANVYQWKFEISLTKKGYQKSCVVGVYGAYHDNPKKSWDRNNYSIPYFSTKDMAVNVGYGYSVMHNQIFGSHPRQQIKCGKIGKIKSAATIDIIMTLDLINRHLSFQSSVHEKTSIGIYVSDKLKYRMAVHFGRKCYKTLTIKMLDFQVNPVNYKNDVPSINIDEQKILESDYDCRKILVKYFKTSKKVMRFNVKSTENIAAIKHLIQQKYGFPFEHSKLIFGSRELHNDYIVSNFGAGDVLILHLVVSQNIECEKKQSESIQLNEEYQNEYDEKIEEFEMTVQTDIDQIEIDNVQKCMQMQIIQLQNDNKVDKNTFEKTLKNRNKQITKLNKEIKKLKTEKNKEIMKLKKEIKTINDCIQANAKKHQAEIMNRQQQWMTHMSSCKNIQKMVDQLNGENMKLKIRIEELESNNTIMKQLISDKEKDNECVACLDLDRCYICLPCGHLCLCENCVKLVNNICPLCQVECSDIIKVFR